MLFRLGSTLDEHGIGFDCSALFIHVGAELFWRVRASGDHVREREPAERRDRACPQHGRWVMLPSRLAKQTGPFGGVEGKLGSGDVFRIVRTRPLYDAPLGRRLKDA